ncbi:MAG: hydantoinase/oxoprolinase family protein [Alphaproteobacteria bacterium]|nr:hydantoinase/oxoprolinase family protein [Alphaproteobacteria bacterium]
MNNNGTPGVRVGVDIGGTFTDLVILTPDGTLEKRKIPSTPDDYAEAIIAGIRDALSGAGGQIETPIAEIVHATTVATNAILERRGARTALITTEGFRDVLELRRIRIPLSYDLGWEKPPPLAERALRFEVKERLDHMGAILTPLDISGLDAIVQACTEEEVAAIAVCFLHSYRNPDHERRVRDYIAPRLPGIHISLSSDILPELQEFERISTTVVNAYVAPLIARYLENLRRKLDAIGTTAPIVVMQSNGGLVPAGTAAERPVLIIESGPAAGVVAAMRAAREFGHDNVITLDMGGTTTKASIIEGGKILRARDYEVGGPVSVSSRLVRGGGYLLRIPVIDISEVGAGGGSIAAIDTGGALRVGPRSAGAAPGPACYGLGNTQPTVTDANLVLGFLHDGSLAGGALTVDRGLAESAVESAVAGPANLSLVEAAHGIHTITNSNMVRAIKTVSIERGRDPADFAMMAFGGAGPIHAAGVAEALGIRRILVPPAPGLFSAFGLLRAEVEHHAARTVLTGTDAPDLGALQSVIDEMADSLKQRIRAEGFAEESIRYSALADMRYLGQSSELMVPLSDLRIGGAALLAAEDAFEAEYERLFGHRADRRAFELVNIHVIATIDRGVEHTARWDSDADDGITAGRHRSVYFGPEAGSRETAILSRQALSRDPRDGPIIVEEYDSTVVVPPGWRAWRDPQDNIVIDFAEAD